MVCELNMIDQTAGMITKTEVKYLDLISTPHGKWWIPFVWACNLVRAARRQGRISDNYLMKALLDVCTVLVFITYFFASTTCKGERCNM